MLIGTDSPFTLSLEQDNDTSTPPETRLSELMTSLDKLLGITKLRDARHSRNLSSKRSSIPNYTTIKEAAFEVVEEKLRDWLTEYTKTFRDYRSKASGESRAWWNAEEEYEWELVALQNLEGTASLRLTLEEDRHSCKDNQCAEFKMYGEQCSVSSGQEKPGRGRIQLDLAATREEDGWLVTCAEHKDLFFSETEEVTRKRQEFRSPRRSPL